MYRVTYPIMCLILYHLLYYYSLLLMQFEILFFFVSNSLPLACVWILVGTKCISGCPNPTEAFCTKQEIMQWWFRLCVCCGSQPVVCLCVCACLLCLRVPACVCVRVCACCWLVFFSHSDAGITPIITTITTSGELLHTQHPVFLDPSVRSLRLRCANVFCR